MGWERLILVAVALVALAALMAWAWPRARRSFIYPGAPAHPSLAEPALHGLPDSEDVWLETDDGHRVHGWWTPASPGSESVSGEGSPSTGPTSSGAVLYCHGNGETMATRAWIARRLADRGYDVLLFDYRGYGLSRGRTTEEGIRRDARAAWRHLVEDRGHSPGQVVLMGHSLGSAVAGRLALDLTVDSEDEETPAALVVGSPFPDMPTLFRRHARWLPPFALRWRTDRLAAGSRLGEVPVPVLVIIGTRDELIPPSFSDQVYQQAGEPGTRVAVPADHGAVMGHPEVWEALDRFLEGVAEPDVP